MANSATNSEPISHPRALIYNMVMASVADSEMIDAKIMAIGEEVQRLPIFRDYDIDLLPQAAAECAEYLRVDDGLDHLLGSVRQGLPKNLYEAAYALVTDVVMPQMDGPTLTKEVKARRPEFKVIYISGYAEDAFRLKVDSKVKFLPKPFNLGQLATKVKEVMAAEGLNPEGMFGEFLLSTR